jgi:hypothetical protein
MPLHVCTHAHLEGPTLLKVCFVNELPGCPSQPCHDFIPRVVKCHVGVPGGRGSNHQEPEQRLPRDHHGGLEHTVRLATPLDGGLLVASCTEAGWQLDARQAE